MLSSTTVWSCAGKQQFFDSVGAVNRFGNEAMQIKTAKNSKQGNKEMARLVAEALCPTKFGVARLLSTSLIRVSFRRS